MSKTDSTCLELLKNKTASLKEFYPEICLITNIQRQYNMNNQAAES